MRKIKQSDFYLSPVFQSLNLSNKNISEIAVEAVENAFEAKVQAVDLSRNQFIEFPLNLDKLIQFLFEINISNNKITSIPSFVGLGELLQFLDFSSNRLSELPSNISDLKHLREIILSMNRFSKIPECLYQCAKLETILIRDNQVNKNYFDFLTAGEPFYVQTLDWLIWLIHTQIKVINLLNKNFLTSTYVPGRPEN